jgi:hypothetical protein
LLRYEVQFKRKLAKTFGKREIRAVDLYDQDLYYRLVKRWSVEYFILQRGVCVRLTEEVKNVKTFDRLVYAKGLEALGGTERVLQMIETARKAGQLDKMQTYRLKTKARELSRLESVTTESEALQELDTKIKQVTTYCR